MTFECVQIVRAPFMLGLGYEEVDLFCLLFAFCKQKVFFKYSHSK